MGAQAASNVSLVSKGDEQTLEIHNVTFESTGDCVSGRPRGERLLLRKTTSSKQVFGEVGEEATTTLEAWPTGVDLKQKPLYTIKVSGTGGKTVDDGLFVVDRGLEEVEWWSVYQLGTGRHLFDSYVPLVSFSISKEILEQRYVGLEIPPDDTPDARLKRPNVVAVLSYASADGVKKEALLTCDDPSRAALLRSYPDTAHTVSALEGRPTRGVRIKFEPYDAVPGSPFNITVPITNDDLDIARAQLPPHLHLAAWKR
jgi:hypothetical protein